MKTRFLVIAAILAFCSCTSNRCIIIGNVSGLEGHGKVAEVTRRYKNTKKKKMDDPELVWKEVKPKS